MTEHSTILVLMHPKMHVDDNTAFKGNVFMRYSCNQQHSMLESIPGLAARGFEVSLAGREGPPLCTSGALGRALMSNRPSQRAPPPWPRPMPAPGTYSRTRKWAASKTAPSTHWSSHHRGPRHWPVCACQHQIWMSWTLNPLLQIW